MSSYPEKKRKRVTTRKKPSLDNKKKPPLVLPNPWLPDDLLISCFARVWRSYYPTLSLVSKSFGSLIASPELYKTRSSLGHTESCLYLCLGFPPPDPIPRWFTLCRKPDRFLTTKKKKKPSGYVLAKLPTPPHSGPTRYWSPLVTIGSNVYCYDEGAFRWYDTKVSHWRALKGVKGLPKFPRGCPRLADYDGKMAVLWHRGVASTGLKEKIIWCAVIALERRNDEEIWGKVEWQEAVLTVPKSCRFQYALATTL